MNQFVFLKGVMKDFSKLLNFFDSPRSLLGAGRRAYSKEEELPSP
jgi:hypothetical protein